MTPPSDLLAPQARHVSPDVRVQLLASAPHPPELTKPTYCLRPDLPPAGRLSHFLNFWKQITSDQWVLRVVESGYRMKFVREPPRTGVRQTSLLRGGDVLLDEVAELCAKSAVEPVPPGQEKDGFYSTYFVVPKKDGGVRPILNLKPFNRCLPKQKFKMETLQSIISIMQPGLWLASVDLKDAYFHVPIARDQWKYLRFSLAGKAYQYRVTPFGLSPAPRLFTRVVREIIAWLRLQGIRVHAYLDDVVLMGNSPQEVLHALKMTIQAFALAGFIINVKKSDLTPTQDLVYIGGRFRTDLGRVFLPEDRVEALVRAVRAFMRVGQLHPARLWLQLLGLMAATITSVLQARYRMRPLQWFLKRRWSASRDSLQTQVMVTREILPALEWWCRRENLAEGRPFQEPGHDVTVTTDASMEGWGGHSSVGGNHQLFSGLWSREEHRRCHINLLELRAIRLTLERLLDHVHHKVVRVECDNTTAICYLNKQGGTKSWPMCQEACLLYEWTLQHSVILQAVHRPGVLNVLADFLSRNRPDPTEWTLSSRATKKLFERWGRPQIDLFASPLNHKLPMWFSRLRCPGATAIDAFNQSWCRWAVYAFPPINLIPRVLLKIREEQVESAVVVVPFWPRRPWFPLLLSMASEKPVRFRPEVTLLSQKLQGKGILYHPDLLSLHLTAWKLNGKLGSVPDTVQQSSAQPWRRSGPRRALSMTADGEVTQPGASVKEPIRFELL